MTHSCRSAVVRDFEKMTRLRLVLLLTPIIFHTGCVFVHSPTECDIARVDEGWMPIAEPPPSIPAQHPSQRKHVVIWFKNENATRVKACERPKREGSCFELGTTFELQGTDWVQLEEIESIVCTG